VNPAWVPITEEGGYRGTRGCFEAPALTVAPPRLQGGRKGGLERCDIPRTGLKNSKETSMKVCVGADCGGRQESKGGLGVLNGLQTGKTDQPDLRSKTRPIVSRYIPSGGGNQGCQKNAPQNLTREAKDRGGALPLSRQMFLLILARKPTGLIPGAFQTAGKTVGKLQT